MTGRPADEDESGPDRAFYVYGVVRADRVTDDLVGIDAAPVRTVSHGAVAAAVGVIATDRPPGRRAELVAHSKVVDALAVAGGVVPVQFGSMLADEQSVIEDLLAPGEDRFSALLDELQGRAQFNLRARYHQDVALAEVVAVDPVIADLRARTRDLPEDTAYGDRVRLGELVSRALEEKRAFDAEVLLEATLPYVAAHSLRSGGSIDHVLDVAFLVDDELRDEFEDRLEGLAEAVHERIQLQLVGPVAPYDFVGDA